MSDNLPIITWPLHERSIPQWLNEQIIQDRTTHGNGPRDMATDTEALAYLMTTSLAMPLSHTWTQIYLHCFTTTMGRLGKEIPPELRVDSIHQSQQDHLSKLKRWIRRQQDRLRKEKKRNHSQQQTNSTKKEETCPTRNL